MGIERERESNKKSVFRNGYRERATKKLVFRNGEREREYVYKKVKEQLREIKKSEKIDYLNKIDCKIDGLMWMILRSEYVKQKKQVFSVKQTKYFSWTDINALRMVHQKIIGMSNGTTDPCGLVQSAQMEMWERYMYNSLMMNCIEVDNWMAQTVFSIIWVRLVRDF